jgi:hypothetical protein
MFSQLSTTFTLLSALLAARLADAKDFDWDIEPKDGFPAVAFNNSTTTKEIVFLYDSPLLYENKTYGVTVFDNDCKTIGSNAITHLEDTSVDRELTIRVDVDQETISNSTYYTPINMTNAVIGLCLRVDYLLNDVSINFHETNLTIDIDLTAGFNPTGLQQMRIEAQQDTVNTNIDYPVVVYHCDEANDKLATKPNLTQGDTLQLCVELDSTVISGNAYVVEIMSIDLNQANMNQNVTYKNIVDKGIPDFFTSKLCQGGVCNIKTQLESRWFTDPIPGDINATGVAILAFGSSGSGQGVRFLRAPIVFQKRRHVDVDESERERTLKHGDDANVHTHFTLTTSLKIRSSHDKNDKIPVLMFVGAALLLVLLFSCGCCLFCVIHRFGFLQGEDCWPGEEEVTGKRKSEVVPELEATSYEEDHTEWSTR